MPLAGVFIALTAIKNVVFQGGVSECLFNLSPIKH